MFDLKKLCTIKAVGLDLGNTLMRYEGVPMSWEKQYPTALQAVAQSLGTSFDGAKVEEACARLALYNTRNHPREIEYTADVIFADALAPLGIGGALPQAIDAFFTFFRQTCAVYEDALLFLHMAGAVGVPAGILTDVPYGMPGCFVALDTRAPGQRGWRRF